MAEFRTSRRGVAVGDEDEDLLSNPRSPFIPARSGEELMSSSSLDGSGIQGKRAEFPIVAVIVSVLRKSVAICSVDRGEEEEVATEIGRPTNVQHVSHVTFDRFNGLLGIPVEFEAEVPRQVLSASTSVFGVSAESMQCSYDARGNSVPTVLLMLQRHLYAQGGLQAEGIFRINAETEQEEYVRDQLNKGNVPYGVNIHCLAGLIKAWFRELPNGVLDALPPEQMMHCNTEAECTGLVQLLSPTEGALLDWAINLMADVVEYEHHNKMNARNVAVVFAPNMTQMADPLTALLHAVQVMNFLKTLILKTLRKREESSLKAQESPFFPKPPNDTDHHSSSMRLAITTDGHEDATPKSCFRNGSVLDMVLREREEHGLQNDADDSFRSVQEQYLPHDEGEPFSARKSQVAAIENGCSGRYVEKDVDALLERLNFRKRMWKICMYPVFHLNKIEKKNSDVEIVT